MTAFRAVPLHVHGALEVLAAPLLLVAPFALGFTTPAGIVSVAIGVLLLGLALSIYAEATAGLCRRPPTPASTTCWPAP
jgi:hypothetical protein